MKLFSFSGGVKLSENGGVRTFRTNLTFSSPDAKDLLARAAALYPNADFTKLRRSGLRSMQTAALAALSVYDSSILSFDPLRTCMICTGHAGCHRENLVYWKDYCENGRVDGRGHLFVGTLATTPLSEAAIALNIRGPVFYLDPGTDASALRSELRRLLLFEKCALALVFADDGPGMTAFAVSPFHPSVPEFPLHELDSFPGGPALLS